MADQTVEQPVVEEPTVNLLYTDPNEVPPPVYIITLDQLLESQQALSSKESTDRVALQRFVEPDFEEAKRKLLQWASLGFPEAFCIFTINIDVPTKCSDGVVRNKFNYVEYLLGDTLANKFQVLQQKIPGMVLSYSLPDHQVCMHVSRASAS